MCDNALLDSLDVLYRDGLKDSELYPDKHILMNLQESTLKDFIALVKSRNNKQSDWKVFIFVDKADKTQYTAFLHRHYKRQKAYISISQMVERKVNLAVLLAYLKKAGFIEG